MPARYPITNFSRGEFGAQLYGRVDVGHYAAGAKQLSNFIVQRYGGVRFRDGFRFVAPILEDDASVNVKLLPFQYSIDQAYVLVMQDNIMNVAANGGMVLEEDLQIVSITYGVTTLFEVPYHDMSVGDFVWVTGNVGEPRLNDQFVEIIGVPDANHIEVDVNTLGYAGLTSSSGIVRVGAPPAPPAPEPPPPVPPPPPDPPPTGSGSGSAGAGSGETGGIQGPQDGDGWYNEP